MGFDLAAHCPQGHEILWPAKAQVTPELVLLLDEDHFRSGICCCKCRGHARRPSSGHKDVGVDVALVIGPVLRRGLHPATGGEALEDLLIGGPEALRLDKCLVVKARTYETPDELIGSAYVVTKRGPACLGLDGHALTQAAVGGAHVRFVADLDDASWIVKGRAQHTAGPVVLEAARKDSLAFGQESRDDRVPVETAVLHPVEGEAEALGAIDDLALLATEARDHGGRPATRADHDDSSLALSTPKGRLDLTSFVRVLRSIRKNFRQPEAWYHFSVVHPAGLLLS